MRYTKSEVRLVNLPCCAIHAPPPLPDRDRATQGAGGAEKNSIPDTLNAEQREAVAQLLHAKH